MSNEDTLVNPGDPWNAIEARIEAENSSHVLLLHDCNVQSIARRNAATFKNDLLCPLYCGVVY
jgi:hypothetical protein